MDASDRSTFVVDIQGRRSLLKPPFSERLRSGSVTLAPGEEVGVHRTDGREEAIIVLRGTATVICEGEELTVKEKQLAYIPPEMEHNVINKTNQLVEYAYVVTPVGGARDVHHHDGHTPALVTGLLKMCMSCVSHFWR